MEENKIQFKDGNLIVPNEPIIPFIEGDGIGVDIWPASKLVLDSAVEKAYSGSKKIIWKEVLAGEKAYNNTEASSTLSFFSFISTSVAAPTYNMATPPDSFANLSCNFSLSYSDVVDSICFLI